MYRMIVFISKYNLSLD